LLAEPSQRDDVAAVSKERLEMVGKAMHHVLKPAIFAFLNGAVSKAGSRGDDRPKRWLDALDAAVDGVFFPRLFADAQRDRDEARRAFAETLRDLALGQLEDAFRAAPTRQARRWQAIALAETVFHGAFRRQFAPYLAAEQSQNSEQN
jgi:hypothetical protein